MSNTGWSKERINQEFANLRAGRGKKCEVEGCTETDHLEFCHIMKTGLSGLGRGKLHRLYDIKKHPDHYALMCGKGSATNHHRKFDNGEFSFRGLRSPSAPPMTNDLQAIIGGY
jgi:hypothetical protein